MEEGSVRGLKRAWRIVVCLIVGIVVVGGSGVPSALSSVHAEDASYSFADSAFRSLWDRTDSSVAAKTATRTFLWGPGPIGVGMQEKYAQSPGGTRLVQYFDKSRMEITMPAAAPATSTTAPTDPFYVTNGLLVLEMMTGRIQVGSDTTQIEVHDPASINAVGDVTDVTAPTYQTLAKLRDLPARAVGMAITDRIDRDANVTAAGPGGVSAATLVPETKHTIASVFWLFMNGPGSGQGDNPNPFYATGYPVTEAYWATVKVGGTAKDVLVQAFERRVLTYTPDNPAGFAVEAGNVGQHYYQWRYQQVPAKPTVTVDATVPISPIVPATLLTGKYNLIPADLPEHFTYRFDGEVTNGYLARNNTDPNYGMYLGQWQRLTGYRRAFTRNEAEGQLSTIQSIISVFRNDKGALAQLNWDRDHARNLMGVSILDGPYGSNSYLKVDVSGGITLYTVVWQQGNVLNSIDVTAAPKGGLTLANARSLAQEQYRRINLDIP